jgi:hypothetical protein
MCRRDDKIETLKRRAANRIIDRDLRDCGEDKKKIKS